jgi:hypothetical protein
MMEMNNDPNWLKTMADKEDGCDVSVGSDPATVQCSWCGGTLLRASQVSDSLIAAAPELLESVKYLRNYAHLADLSDITAEHLDKIIAKAEQRDLRDRPYTPRGATSTRDVNEASERGEG